MRETYEVAIDLDDGGPDGLLQVDRSELGALGREFERERGVQEVEDGGIERRGRVRRGFSSDLTMSSEPFQPPASPASPALVRPGFGFGSVTRSTATSAATGLPFRVMITDSPCSTLRRQSASRDFA